MTNDKPAREWWLVWVNDENSRMHPIAQSVRPSDMPGYFHCHVIEYEAFAKVCAELERERNEHAPIEADRLNLQDEVARLRAELKIWIEHKNIRILQERNAGKDALLAEAVAALETCRKYFGWDHIDAVPKPPSGQECTRVIDETLARLRAGKGGA